MTDDRERIVDLLLQKTHEGRVAWQKRGSPPAGLGGFIKETYTARIQSNGGELFAIFRKDPWEYSLRVVTPPAPLSLVMKNVKTGNEFRIEPETPILAKKLQELWDTIEQRGTGELRDIIEVLEET